MNVKILSTGIVATIIMILLASSVLIPVVSEAQKVAGEEVKYSSSGARVGKSFQEIANDTHVSYDVSTEGIICNGEPIGPYQSAATWGDIICGENGNVQVRISTYAVRFAEYTENAEVTTSISLPCHIELNGSIITIGDYTLDVGAGYFLMPSGDYYLAVELTNRFGTWYVNSINDVTVYGVYTTGENDTKYSLKDGEVTTSEEYESSVSYDLTLVEGTTDVYLLTNFKIIIGGEEFVPYNSIIIKECYGHKDSGATYSLVGLIPILVLAGLVIGVVGMFISRRD